MNTTISERDKTLITILAVIVIIAVFSNYLIYPMIKKSDELDLEIQEQTAKKEEMQQKIIMLPGQEQLFETMKKDFSTVCNDYYPLLTSQEIDKEITGIALKCGLDAKDLVIKMPGEVSPLEPYYASAMADQKELERLQQEAEAAEEQEKNSDFLTTLQEDAGAEKKTQLEYTSLGENTEIYAAEVHLNVDGTEKQYQNLIDLLNKEYPAIRVTDYTYTDKKEEIIYDKDGKIKEKSTGKLLDIGMEFYMCSKTFAVEESGEN